MPMIGDFREAMLAFLDKRSPKVLRQLGLPNKHAIKTR